MHDGFVKIAAGVPDLILANPSHNADVIISLAQKASSAGAAILVLPELCITGATCGDLFRQSVLLSAAESALTKICAETENLDLLIFLGLPVKIHTSVFNCVAAIQRGRILGLTPKMHLTSYADRCFAAPDSDVRVISIAGQETTLGTGIVYCHEQIQELRIAAEVGADMFAPLNPAGFACVDGGATVIVNCAAIPERAGESKRRIDLLRSFSQRLCCGYVLSNAGTYESTTDDVFAGNCIIAESGDILCERKSFDKCDLIYSEIDVQAISALRATSGEFTSACGRCEEIYFDSNVSETTLTREISRDPFLHACGGNVFAASNEIIDIQSHGLARRILHVGAKRAVIGISGGLDSTLALLATVKAFDLLQRSRREIICVTMPCFGTTVRTKDNAKRLADLFGCELKTIPIKDAVLQHFHDIGHDPQKADVTYENSQARERTQILMDLANREGGIVIGTGDLSELALGFATYNGDHMSMYGLNATVPKTMIRHIVSCYANECNDAELKCVLRDILDTPVSPELLPVADGEISQKTEEILGDYILQDFFIYYTLRYGFSPEKLLRLTEYAFQGDYQRSLILDKLRLFYRRFFSQQFKRSCLPDGPATGLIGFSPRGVFSMPSDAAASLWLSELENL